MKLVILTALAVATWAAPTGNTCNYAPVGDESNQKAVPIKDFRTSGLDFVRPNWCITHCADRTSVLVAARFQFANSSSAVPAYKIHRSVSRHSGIKVSAEVISGEPRQRDDDDDDEFCIDQTVADAIHRVVNENNDLDTMAEALNYYVNKPGWAFVIYDMGPPPSIIETVNVHIDMNYCEKVVVKKMPDGSEVLYQVFAGLIKAD
uniref:DOMON domain-containing protein n=1 Tax=Caenorhabditis japonica TaxID=281687 RepID=A0A8R1I2V5_CAEJA